MAEIIANKRNSLLIAVILFILSIMSWWLGFYIGLYCLIVIALLGTASILFFFQFLQDKKRLSKRAIIGISISAFILILLVLAVVVWLIAIDSGV